MRVYLASSWRNPFFNEVYKHLSSLFDVYNWKHSSPEGGFSEWTTMPDLQKGQKCTIKAFCGEMKTQRTADHFARDKTALIMADIVVLLLPCGLSAHMEAAYAAGIGKPILVFAPEGELEPELMYGLIATEGRVLLFEDINALMEMLRHAGSVL